MNTADENPATQKSELCYQCGGRLYNAMAGTCTVCGEDTSSSGFTLCFEHALASNACACCGGQLDAVKPPTSPDARLVYLVGLLDPDDEQASREPRELLARAGTAVDDFKSIAAERFSGEVGILNEMRAVGMVVIRCISTVAEALRNLPEVYAITENR